MFYTYLWLREDGTPYYVGKGKGNRGFESKSHRHECPPKERIIIQSWDSEEEAFEAEKFLIAHYGRIDLSTGCLRNLTDGGENPPSWKGRKRTKENCEKVGNANRGKIVSAETRLKQSVSAKNRTDSRGRSGFPKGCSPWNKGLHGVQKSWNQGLKMSLETRQRQSVAAKNRDPKTRRGPETPWSPRRRAAQNLRNAKRKSL
jgi:hypothetical protein